MRENMGLYRGKRTDNGEWAIGCLTHDIDGTLNQIEVFKRYCLCDIWEVDPSTVGQDTGLTDKSGKRIFEGDVVSGLFLYALPINSVCVFRDGAFGLEWERGGAKQFTAFTSMCNVEFEVIGNVHDNPELKGDC